MMPQTYQLSAPKHGNSFKCVSWGWGVEPLARHGGAQHGPVALAQAGAAAWPQREGGLRPCLLHAACGPKGGWSQGWTSSSSDSSSWKKDRYWQTRFPWPIVATRWFKPHMWNGCNVRASELRHKAGASLAVLELGTASSLIHVALNAHGGLHTWMPKQVCLYPLFLLIIFLWLWNSKANFIFIKPCACLMRILTWKLSPSTGILGIRRL